MKQKSFLINLVLIFFVFLIIVCGCKPNNKDSASGDDSAPRRNNGGSVSRSSGRKPPVTKAQAEQITWSMSREEVYRILGSEGDLWFESNDPVNRYDIRIWQGTEPKKGLKVSFSNDKVMDVKFNVE